MQNKIVDQFGDSEYGQNAEEQGNELLVKIQFQVGRNREQAGEYRPNQGAEVWNDVHHRIESCDQKGILDSKKTQHSGSHHEEYGHLHDDPSEIARKQVTHFVDDVSGLGLHAGRNHSQNDFGK